MNRRFVSLVLCLLFVLPSTITSASASSGTQAAETAAWVLAQTPNPQIGSVGGEWCILGLARSGAAVASDYYSDYISAVEKAVDACSGQLSSRKYTEYSRVILALTAIGCDPTNVAGYNLLLPLGDYERTVWQGINGSVFALLALDSGNYSIPENKGAATQATRALYVQDILRQECPSGGFALSGKTAEADLTADALIALFPYADQPQVSAAIQRGLNALSTMQLNDGSYANQGLSNCESTAQVVIALSALGISSSDLRFVKNGRSAAEALFSFAAKDGGFSHTRAGSFTGMATEQALCALAALSRFEGRKTAFYAMSDVAKSTFTDIAGHPYQTAIESLAAYKIMGGMGGGTFAPEAGMTRAQFAVVLARSLNLKSSGNHTFSDVPDTAWYASAVNAASDAGLLLGVGDHQFQPQGKVTVRAAEHVLTRAAALQGLSRATGSSITDSAPITRAELAQKLYVFLQETGRL